MVKIVLRRLDSALPLPAYARAHDAGLDLYARETVRLNPGERALVGTGIAVAIPPGFAGFIVPRSGLALRSGVTLLNTPGLIDAGYRGELKVLLVNHDGKVAVTIERGERVAQLVIHGIERADLIEADDLPASERGVGGFGSTGV